METVGFWEISRGILEILRVVLYWYYVGQAGTIEKGKRKRILGFCIAAACLACSLWIPSWLSWLLVACVLLLYDLFFDEEPFARQWWRVLLPGLALAACDLLPWILGLWGMDFGVSGGGLLDVSVSGGGLAADAGILAAQEPLMATEPLAAAWAFLCHGPILFVFFLLFSIRRQSLRLWNGILMAMSFFAITAFQWLLCGTQRLAAEGELKGILLWG